MRACVAEDTTSPRCPWAPPSRLDGTNFPFALTDFCSCMGVLYMSVPGTGFRIGCWK